MSLLERAGLGQVENITFPDTLDLGTAEVVPTVVPIDMRLANSDEPVEVRNGHGPEHVGQIVKTVENPVCFVPTVDDDLVELMIRTSLTRDRRLIRDLLETVAI